MTTKPVLEGEGKENDLIESLQAEKSLKKQLVEQPNMVRLDGGANDEQNRAMIYASYVEVVVDVANCATDVLNFLAYREFYKEKRVEAESRFYSLFAACTSVTIVVGLGVVFVIYRHSLEVQRGLGRGKRVAPADEANRNDGSKDSTLQKIIRLHGRMRYIRRTKLSLGILQDFPALVLGLWRIFRSQSFVGSVQSEDGSNFCLESNGVFVVGDFMDRAGLMFLVSFMFSLVMFTYRMSFALALQSMKWDLKELEADHLNQVSQSLSSIDSFEDVSRDEIRAVLLMRKLLEEELRDNRRYPYLITSDYYLLSWLRTCKGDPYQAVDSVRSSYRLWDEKGMQKVYEEVVRSKWKSWCESGERYERLRRSMRLGAGTHSPVQPGKAVIHMLDFAECEEISSVYGGSGKEHVEKFTNDILSWLLHHAMFCAESAYKYRRLCLAYMLMYCETLNIATVKRQLKFYRAFAQVSEFSPPSVSVLVFFGLVGTKRLVLSFLNSEILKDSREIQAFGRDEHAKLELQKFLNVSLDKIPEKYGGHLTKSDMYNTEIRPTAQPCGPSVLWLLTLFRDIETEELECTWRVHELLVREYTQAGYDLDTFGPIRLLRCVRQAKRDEQATMKLVLEIMEYRRQNDLDSLKMRIEQSGYKKMPGVEKLMSAWGYKMYFYYSKENAVYSTIGMTMSQFDVDALKGMSDDELTCAIQALYEYMEVIQTEKSEKESRVVYNVMTCRTQNVSMTHIQQLVRNAKLLAKVSHHYPHLNTPFTFVFPVNSTVQRVFDGINSTGLFPKTVRQSLCFISKEEEGVMQSTLGMNNQDFIASFY